VDETACPVGESLETEMEGRESREESKKHLLGNLGEETALERGKWGTVAIARSALGINV
jgi:hypothetical protein